MVTSPDDNATFVIVLRCCFFYFLFFSSLECRFSLCSFLSAKTKVRPLNSRSGCFINQSFSGCKGTGWVLSVILIARQEHGSPPSARRYVCAWFDFRWPLTFSGSEVSEVHSTCENTFQVFVTSLSKVPCAANASSFRVPLPLPPPPHALAAVISFWLFLLLFFYYSSLTNKSITFVNLCRKWEVKGRVIMHDLWLSGKDCCF